MKNIFFLLFFLPLTLLAQETPIKISNPIIAKKITADSIATQKLRLSSLTGSGDRNVGVDPSGNLKIVAGSTIDTSLFVRKAGSQVITGNKTFSGGLLLTNDTTQTQSNSAMTEQQVKREIAAGNKWTTTSKGVKYIGLSGDSVTIDNLAGGLKIYKSGQKYFDVTNNSNVGIGRNTLDAVGTGTYNVGLGYSSMYNNTGNENIAIGNAAITANRDGSWNIGIGTRSLYAHKTGYNNIALGYYSLTGDTSGYNNVAIGYISLSANKNGFNNTSIGALSLISTVTGNSNIALGAYSGRYNTFNNRLFINSLDRGNILGDSTKSIIYGIQDALASNQRLYFNAGKTFASGDFTASKYYLSSLNTAPSSSTDTGTTGEMRITSDYIYVCTATNTWKRVAISTW